jgi:hypothetical protein
MGLDDRTRAILASNGPDDRRETFVSADYEDGHVFAFGRNKMSKRPDDLDYAVNARCPAYTAGYEPGEADGVALVRMAEQYDDVMKHFASSLDYDTLSRGHTSEDVARYAWFLAIEELEQAGPPRAVVDDAVTWGHRIADELGWNDPL